MTLCGTRQLSLTILLSAAIHKFIIMTCGLLLHRKRCLRKPLPPSRRNWLNRWKHNISESRFLGFLAELQKLPRNALEKIIGCRELLSISKLWIQYLPHPLELSTLQTGTQILSPPSLYGNRLSIMTTVKLWCFWCYASKQKYSCRLHCLTYDWMFTGRVCCWNHK